MKKELQFYISTKANIASVISDFRRRVKEILALLGCYAVYVSI
jgi:hypothetical protein